VTEARSAGVIIARVKERNMPRHETDLIEAAKRRNSEEQQQGAPRRAVVAMKLMRYLQGGKAFPAQELRVVGELIEAGVQHFEDEGKDEAAIWADLDQADAADAEAAKRDAAKRGEGR
jgi:hypothetical protein